MYSNFALDNYLTFIYPETYNTYFPMLISADKIFLSLRKIKQSEATSTHAHNFTT